jgi:hypothetical protein
MTTAMILVRFVIRLRASMHRHQIVAVAVPQAFAASTRIVVHQDDSGYDEGDNAATLYVAPARVSFWHFADMRAISPKSQDRLQPGCEQDNLHRHSHCRYPRYGDVKRHLTVRLQLQLREACIQLKCFPRKS